ncbi:CAP domain-containing protein [Nocardiopsis sp. RSe5-2]|uniref:CAP domain-containing protein n=1 Tax=Nocardiopsis endophytica TaxID=3018445 RepID=A0ABT4U8L2_9ACTN|nr:CAP domain-containing protein [Nocardiopsis endophytica]MDA2813286.1 CAP domain-containing protein [Nocardiopsis endophytica]
MLATVLALPVGLGTAAALVLATAGGPELTSQAAMPKDGSEAGTGADNGLPPAADDFFDGSEGASGAQGGSGGGSGAEGSEGSEGSGSGDGGTGSASSGKDSVSASEEPAEDGSGDREDGASDSSSGDSGGSGGSGGAGAQGGGSALTREVVSLANDERADAGCGPLRIDSKLTNASQKHSKDMAERDYMSHDTPEGVGPADRAAEAGYTAWGGENVAAGYTSAEAVMDGWMNSEGHRKNILNCDFVAIGVGETDGYWAQNFGYS